MEEHFIVLPEPLDITKVNLMDLMSILDRASVSGGSPEEAMLKYLSQSGAIGNSLGQAQGGIQGLNQAQAQQAAMAQGQQSAAPGGLQIVADNGASDSVARFESRNKDKPL